MKIAVLAGGVGQRLWPLSKASSPKQIQPIFGRYTLLQQTINRLLRQFRESDIFIVTGKEFLPALAAQIPEFPKNNVLIEPARRNTAAAIGLAAYSLAEKNPEEILISVAADHFINPEKEFLKNLLLMEQVVKKNPQAVCLMGIKPAYPETGYGYIQTGRKTDWGQKFPLFTIKKFVEKPKLRLAKKFLASKQYLWNPSYFAWRVGHLQELYAKFIPQTHQLLKKTVSGQRSAFKKIKAAAIEYAILEKIQDNFFVLPAKFIWADIGHWASVKEIQAKQSSNNVTLGLQYNLDTKNSLIYNYTDRLVSAVGVKDLLIIQTEDGTLVCDKSRAQDVGKLVEEMRKIRKLRKFL